MTDLTIWFLLGSTANYDALPVAAARVFGPGFRGPVAHRNGLVDELTVGLGADVAVEAVGTPETFEATVGLVRPAVASPTSACTER
jgi:hypothetical protein